MSAEPIQEKAAVRLDTSTRLAYERTYLAHERTQMAWLRTCLSFISFGFTISKFFEFLQQRGAAEPLLNARAVGIVMIAIGMVALALAFVQHLRLLRTLRARCPDLPFSLAGLTAVLLASLGILALLGAVLRA